MNKTIKRLRIFDRLHRLVRWFIRQWDKTLNLEGRLLMVHNDLGKWRVVYPDGLRSQKFCYKTAKTYRAIFGGKVIWVRYEKPTPRRSLRR